MNASPSIAALAAALAKAQGDFPAIPKGKTAKAGQYSYDYADLADMISALQPVLAANGLCVTQDPATIIAAEGRVAVEVTTTILHSSGEWLQSKPLAVPVEGTKAQAIGIATTYARRYSYGAALGVSPDADTDGQDDHPTERKPAKAATPRPPPVQSVPPPKPAGPTIAERREAVKAQLHTFGFGDEAVQKWVRSTLGHPFDASNTNDIRALENELSLIEAERRQAKAK